MTMASDIETSVEAKQRLGVAAGAALLGAGLILVMFVLPAEYGVDPLGTGAWFGLTELGATGKAIEFAGFRRAYVEGARSGGTEYSASDHGRRSTSAVQIRNRGLRDRAASGHGIQVPPRQG